MASSLINYIVDNYLSKFIEIDKSQTYASLWSGVLELKNLKIKKDSFSYINLPYFILEKGYIGKIKVQISMPFFYSNPINIYIEDIFLYSKQKDINNLKEEEEIKSLKDIKNKKLISEEELFSKLEEIETEEPSFINQIINNININIKNFVLRFEDSISNPEIPFSLGIILKNFNIKSANGQFELLNDTNNSEKEIKENYNIDFTYKLISTNDLYIFLDCVRSSEELNYNKLIDASIKENIPSEMTKYLGDIFDFYSYCQSELTMHFNNKLLHDFILYQLDVDMKISINSNLQNNNPKYELNIDNIDNFVFQLNLSQLSNLFLLLSYYNLFNYYQLGLSKYVFNKKIKEEERIKYIFDYIDYYYKKYKSKSLTNENASFYFQEIDKILSYEEIKKLRKIALNNLFFYVKQKELEDKINAEKNKWFFSPNTDSINNYNKELKEYKEQLKNYIELEQNEKYSLIFENKEKDELDNLPDDFTFYIAKIEIKKFSFKIFNDIQENINYNNNNKKEIEKYKKLLDFYLEDTIISYEAKKYNTRYSISIKNFILSQNIVKNKEYDKILIAKSNKEEEHIFIEYQTNKDDSGNFINKIIFKVGMQVYLFANLYIIQYINKNILSCLYSFISFIEIPGYADDNINKYLQLGYIINEYNKEYKKLKQAENSVSKFEYDINIKNPIMIIPQDILNSNNKKCIFISTEEIILRSDLIKENIGQKNTRLTQENNNISDTNSNYESCLSESNIIDNIYDKHFLNINKIQIYLSYNCVKEENYEANENIFVHYFNLSVLYKTLINLNDKDKAYSYNNSSLMIDIKDLYFSINEFQILFLLTYLKEMKYQNELLKESTIKQYNDKDKIIDKYFNEYKKDFIKKLESNGIISKDEYIIEKDRNDNSYIRIENKVRDQNDFNKNSNKFYFELNINEIKIVIYKIYPDLSKANFIDLKLTKIQLLKLNNYYDDSLMTLELKNITVIDKEQDIKKNFLLAKEFRVLIKNDNENINCISYSNLYINDKKENVTNIEVNNMDIISSFDSLARIYSFSMYYLGIYQNIQYEENNNKKLNISRINMQRDSRYRKEGTIIKEEKITNQNILKFKLINSFFRIPYDEKDIKMPIFSTKLNIFYEQSSNSENQNIYDIKNKEFIESKLLYNNKNMNLMICESDFDIIFIYPSYKDNKTEKIITNYRIQFTSKYSYFLAKKNSISNMNILVEPLIITIDLYQLNYCLSFYNQMMKFVFESLYMNYVPYLKPEDIAFVKGKPIIVKRKRSLAKIINYVIELHKIKKKMYKIYEIRKKRKNNLNKNNLLKNSFNSINFQLDKIYIRVLDNNGGKEKRILLALELSKIFFNKINNSNPKDKTNVSNELFGIITNSPVSIDSYIIRNLYNYMNSSFTLELYYYNLEYSDFEPIIEPININYLSYQIDKIFRSKTYINIENIININVSTNCIKVLNIFLSKYSKDNIKDKINNEEEEEISTTSKKKSNKLLHLYSKDNNNIEEQEETVLKVFNQTGLFIYFWFDFDKENKIKINNNEVIHLSNKSIYKTRKHKKLIQKKEFEKNTFSFRILNYESIQKINFNKTNNLYFKTEITNDKNDKKYIYYNIKINTSSLVKEIIFESSLTILNETMFDELLLSIDDNYIEENKINLVKNKKVHIPLTWIISSKNVYLQKNKNTEKVLIYNNISEIIFSDKLSQSELREKEKQIEKTKETLENKLNNYEKINLHHPKYKDYISTFVVQKFNQKKSKIISIINEKKEIISFFLDYCSLIDKGYEITSEDNNINKNDEKIYQFLEYTTKSLEYILFIRPILNFTNSTPFDIKCINNQDNYYIHMEKLKTIELYNELWLNDDSLIKLEMVYNNENYETDYINLNNKNYLNTIYFSNKQNAILRCNISHNLLTKNSIIFDNELEQYSTLSYNYVIFFDFIINNRMGFDLYGIDIKDINNINNNTYNFNKDSLSVFSSDKEDVQKLLVSSNENTFNNKMKVNVNAINLENVIEIEQDKNIYNILCKASTSINYIYSNILLFEPKYILFNDLDFTIYFQQINESNKPVDEIKKLASKSEVPLIYKKEKKIIFKIGIKANKKSPLISYSGLFELDNSMEYDLKVEVDNSYKSQYPKNVYYMSKKLYLYFRVKNKTTDEGNVYSFITFPEFPILEIDNRTTEQIKIYETKKDEPIIINSMSKIPFIWKNNIIMKSKFKCEIAGKQNILSFSDYNKIEMNIGKNRFIYIYNHQKNTLTGTRCLTFEEIKLNRKKKLKKDIKEDLLESINSKKKIKSLNLINIFIKGIGLSFLDEAPKEIFYISFYEISLLYSNSYLPSLKHTNENYESFEFYLKNFQIDSSLNNSLKTLIYPKNQNIPSLETEDKSNENEVNFISLLIVKNSNSNIAKEIQSIKYPQIDLCIQEIIVKIDQIIVMNLFNLIKNYTSKLDYFKASNNIKLDVIEEENLLKKIKIPFEELKNEKRYSNKILINYLFLSAIKINLTFRLDLSSLNISHLPKIVSRVIGSLGSSLVRISDSSIKFNEKIIENIYMEINEIAKIIIKSFIKESILQIYKILGSADLIGNPVQLIEKIGTGFFEFVNEPRKGLLKGPTQFGKGLAKGVAGLLNGVVGGTFDSVSKISGTLYNLVQNLTGKENDLIIDDDNEPSNILTGASKGLKDGFQELYNGLTGLVINPIQRTVNSDSNPLKFIKDLGIGLVGFAISPVNFVLKIGNSLAIGTKNTFNYFYSKNIKNKRFRFPRYIKENSPLTIYDPDLSAAKEFLYKLLKIESPNILYFSQFLCQNRGYYGVIAYLLLTNEQLLLLSNEYEIFLNIDLSNINNIELKYNGKNFEFLFYFNKEQTKALIIDKKNSVFVCELYCVLDNRMNMRKQQDFGFFKKPVIKKFKNALQINVEDNRRKRIIERNKITNELEKTIENNNSFYFVNGNEIIEED